MLWLVIGGSGSRSYVEDRAHPDQRSQRPLYGLIRTWRSTLKIQFQFGRVMFALAGRRLTGNDGVDHTRAMASVSLLIRGRSLDPDELTRLLGLKPTRTWKRGESIIVAGRTVRKRRADSGWHFWSTPEQRRRTMDWLIARWTRILSAKDNALRQIHAAGWTISLDCCVARKSEAFRLSPRFSKRLAALNVTFAVTCYASIC